MVSLSRNDYEPDVCFWSINKSNRFQQRQAQFPAPDFVVEVLSVSTEANDRGIRYQDYESHGVREYWIVDPEKQTVEQYLLEADQYELRMKAADGIVKSVAVDGFTIPVRTIFDEEENVRILALMWKNA